MLLATVLIVIEEMRTFATVGPPLAMRQTDALELCTLQVVRQLHSLSYAFVCAYQIHRLISHSVGHRHPLFQVGPQVPWGLSAGLAFMRMQKSIARLAVAWELPTVPGSEHTA